MTVTEDEQPLYEIYVPDWMGNNGVVERGYFIVNPEHTVYKNGKRAIKIILEIVKAYPFLTIEYKIDKIIRELKIDFL